MTFKVQKTNPVAKALQDKRFHEQVRHSKKAYSRSESKKEMREIFCEVEETEYENLTAFQYWDEDELNFYV